MLSIWSKNIKIFKKQIGVVTLSFKWNKHSRTQLTDTYSCSLFSYNSTADVSCPSWAQNGKILLTRNGCRQAPS